MLDQNAMIELVPPHVRRLAALARLPRTELTRAVTAAFACHINSLETAEDDEDAEACLSDFWLCADQVTALPARTPGDAAAKASLAALLLDRECEDAALALLDGLTTDLAAMAHSEA